MKSGLEHLIFFSEHLQVLSTYSQQFTPSLLQDNKDDLPDPTGSLSEFIDSRAN